MTSPPRKAEKDGRVTVSSLLSPPETKTIDSFNSPTTAAMTRTPASSFAYDFFSPSSHKPQHTVQRNMAGLPLSPPISPQTATEKENINSQEDSAVVGGSELYRAGSKLVADFPLFPPEQNVAPETESLIAKHINKSNKDEEKPTPIEYLEFVSCVSKFWTRPGFWEAERERNKNVGRSFLPTHAQGRIAKPTLSNNGRKVAPVSSASVRRSKPLPLVPRIASKPRQRIRTPKERVLDSFETYNLPTPKVSRPPTNRDDIDYQTIPDFSPPISTLGNNSKILKADWKGQTLDLFTDPDRHLLHEAELNLAATLRLSCATYLCSKRRIFQARIEALRIGKEFRKTDAQQACKIDVNKASKLWSAYEKVGWFDPKYFNQYR